MLLQFEVLVICGQLAIRYFIWFSTFVLDSFEYVSIDEVFLGNLGHWWKICISIWIPVVSLQILLALLHYIKIIDRCIIFNKTIANIRKLYFSCISFCFKLRQLMYLLSIGIFMLLENNNNYIELTAKKYKCNFQY